MAVIDRIKFNGIANKNWLVYKYPGDCFVYGSQLIVGDGQVAVFVKGGKAYDYFTPGTYTLSTQNIPLLTKVINLPFGRKTPFTAEVYFINTIAKLGIYWGTVDPIQVIDPKYQVKLRVRGFGQLGIRIADYQLFLSELIGNIGDHDIVSFEKVMSFFKGLITTKMKTIIADAIINKDISALELSAKLEDISDFGKEELKEEFSRFGVEVVNFFVESINFPDEDFEAINAILKEKAAFDIIGPNRYVSKRSFDVMQTMAGNKGIPGGGMGLGAGLAAASVAGGAMGNVSRVINPGAALDNSGVQVIKCPKCGRAIPATSKFCPECGEKVQGGKTCPKCKSPVQEGQKFCTECGTALIDEKKCGECGATNPATAKFCSECGKPLKSDSN